MAEENFRKKNFFRC